MDEKMPENQKKLISLGEYTIDLMGMDSLCWHLREEYQNKTIEIFVKERTENKLEYCHKCGRTCDDTDMSDDILDEKGYRVCCCGCMDKMK